MAWVRSLLTIAVVVGLIVRAFVLENVSWGYSAIAVLFAAVMIVILTQRYRQLKVDGTSAAPKARILEFVVMIMCLAALGVVSVALSINSVQ